MLKYFLFVLGLTLLIKAADWLVRGGSSFARRLNVSDFIIGLTVVSFGTSLPELIIGLIAGEVDSPDLIIGNVIGSNIANIFLVLGIASMIYPLATPNRTVWREIPYTLLASLILLAMLNDGLLDGVPESLLGRTDGLVLLAFFAVFLYYLAMAVADSKETEWVGSQEEEGLARATAETIAGIVGLALGGKLCVDNARVIAADWGMSEAFIGLTIVAVGTSLPEVATSAVAAYKRNANIAVGNVVGSNIFNIFIVLGISSVVHTLPFNPRNNVDLLVMVFTTIVLFVFMFVGRPLRTIQRREGFVFVLLYALYIAFLLMRESMGVAGVEAPPAEPPPIDSGASV